MAIDNFTEVFNMVCIAKKLHDMDKYELVENSFYDTLEYDTYFESMYNLIGNLFEYHDCNYYESQYVDVQIFSDPVIVDFYVLAGKYGRRNNIKDENNPYIKAAENEAHDNLYISHCLGWRLVGHTEPKRPYHSRLELFISQECGCLDLGVLAYALIEIYEWFSDKCVELSNILGEDAAGQLIMDMAA